jgi:hypothetical protein
MNERAVYFAEQHDFEKALQYFKKFQKEETSHDSAGRFLLGVKYFHFLEMHPQGGTAREIIEFLNLLTNPKNDFAESKNKKAREAIIGLCGHLGRFGPLDHSIRSQIALMLKKIDRANQASMASGSLVEQSSRTMMTLEEILGTKADVLIDQLSERVPLTFLREHDAIHTSLPSNVATEERQQKKMQKYNA